MFSELRSEIKNHFCSAHFREAIKIFFHFVLIRRFFCLQTLDRYFLPYVFSEKKSIINAYRNFSVSRTKKKIFVV